MTFSYIFLESRFSALKKRHKKPPETALIQALDVFSYPREVVVLNVVGSSPTRHPP